MYRVNAQTEDYELVTVFGKPAIFTNSRIDRNSVPHNLHMYEVRHDDDQQGNPVELGDSILVNHWGTILSSSKIPLGKLGFREIGEDDWNYEGVSLSLNSYIRSPARHFN